MRIEEIRTGLGARLRKRRPEIEEAAITRVHAVSDPREASDPEYMEGLWKAISAALDYGIAALEHSEDSPPPVPPELLCQARLAARNRVSLDTVLRRYFAGYSLLGDFVIEEAEKSSRLSASSLKRLLRAQAALFDGLLLAISSEYRQEADRYAVTAEQRRAERVERLLNGELVDTAELAYDLDSHHLALIATGPGTASPIRDLAHRLDRRLLLLPRDDASVWAWLSGRRMFEPVELEHVVSNSWPAHAALAIGEPGRGLAGWRLTHQQAKAALPIAVRSVGECTRYRDVALLASTRQDHLLLTSLRQLYLNPLERERDGGQMVRRTLRAYFTSGRNVSSAAAKLGVSRQTVSSRLRAVEERVGQPLTTCAAEIETGLRLQDLARG